MTTMENLTRRSLLLGFSAATLAGPLSALESAVSTDNLGTLLYAGVYTDQGSRSLGIYSYRWNPDKGEMTALGLAAATPNPSFLAVSPDKRTLYAVNEIDNFRSRKDGAVSSFLRDSRSGSLKVQDVVSSMGSGPCNINLDHSGRSVFAANYTGGSDASFKADGSKLSVAVSNHHYDGHGPNDKRQETAHAHCVTASPGNGFLLVNDLGLDKIHIYKLHAATAELKAHTPAAYEAAPGSGPRSFAFHPNGHVGYSTNELANTVDVLHWSEAKGTLTRVQNICSLTPGTAYDNAVTVASVNVSADGRFVYVSNRGANQNSLTVFSVDASSGKLAFVQNIASGGKIPRHFAIDPSGKWIVVAHQGSHTLVVFSRDEKTGKLTATGRSYPVDWPTCVLFV